MKKIHKLKFRYTEGWIVSQDKFFSIEPNNSLPLGEVAGYFNEHLFQGLYGDFVIDVGFHGTYHLDRVGRFSIYLLKGNFYKGELLEKRIFENTAQAAACVQELIDKVSQGAYKKTEGLKFKDDTIFVNLKTYSAHGTVGFKRWA